MDAKEMDEKEREIAERLIKSLKKVMEEVKIEPLGNLNVPIEDVLAVLNVLRQTLSDDEFRKIITVFSVLYHIESDKEFMLRLGKTLTIVPNELNPTKLEDVKEIFQV
jgi:hypothetical protein